MEERRRLLNSTILFHEAQLLRAISVISSLLFMTRWSSVGASSAAAATTQELLLRGFTATSDPTVPSFQALLTESSGNYSLGFLRVDQSFLALAVVHVPSSEQLWQANATRLAKWSDPTKLLFNGSLVLMDQQGGVIWSTSTNGDRVWLSNSSNLQIQKLNGSISTLWQSFDFPTDTLMENQTFTSLMSLVASNGPYVMKLGSDFMGLYAKFQEESGADQIYWKHGALQAKAEIIEGQGPIHAILNSEGYLGMYQNGSIPVDIQSFNSFQQRISGVRRVRMEPDGNLKGYYWSGSSWILDYQAISNPCELPSSCGPYGLCQSGKGCSCLDNRTKYDSGGCASPDIIDSGDLCGVSQNKYWVLRRNGVELPYKELMGHKRMDSLKQCEGACEVNCTCWGALYSNTSGFCYMLNYPIQTILAVGDDTNVGYFKVRKGAEKKGIGLQFKIFIGLLCGAILLCGGIMGFACYKMNRGKRGVSEYLEEDGEASGVGPYKNLRSASFKSIELCER